MKTFNNLDECIQEIKRLRVQVDALIQIAEKEKVSAETTLAWRSLQMAKSWLGKLLGDVNKTSSPYIVTSDPSKIVPTQDVAQIENPPKWSTLDMCNSQRAVIETTIEEFRDLWYAPNLQMLIEEHNEQVGFPTEEQDVKRVQEEGIYTHYDYFNLIQNHLQEARFWYGFEIANLRPQ